MFSCRGKPLTTETKKLLSQLSRYFDRNKFEPMEPSTKRTCKCYWHWYSDRKENYGRLQS